MLYWFTVDEKQNADLWLLNSCTVKNPAEDHFRNEIKLAESLDKKVVVAGCVPQGERKTGYLQVSHYTHIHICLKDQRASFDLIHCSQVYQRC